MARQGSTVATLWLLLILAPLVAADTPGVALKPDLRLLIDVSSSMEESDPGNLRAPALELMVRLLPEGSRAGVWTFGETVDNLVPHGVVDEAWRQQAAVAVAAINNDGQRTNVPAALAAATYDLGSMDPRYRSSIVLLTDGKVDVSESPMANVAAARKVLETTAPNLREAGIRVHTIALSDEADWSLLRSLARATGGFADRAASAEALASLYLQALEMVAPTAQVPVSGSRFTIDESVRKFNAVIFLPEQEGRVRLISPGGERLRPADQIAGVSWQAGPGFVMVAVAEPDTGSWQIEAPEDVTTRVTALSTLELEVDPLPNSLSAGRAGELGVRLRQRGDVISSPELLSVFGITVEISGAGGTLTRIDVSGDYPAPADGEYRVTIPPFDLPGRYTLTVQLDSGTLQRELPMLVEVTGTPSREVISTRALDVPMEDFQGTALTLGVLLLVGVAMVLWVLRRRKQRKLETYQRRFRAVPGSGDDSQGASGGDGADDART